MYLSGYTLSPLDGPPWSLSYGSWITTTCAIKADHY